MPKSLAPLLLVLILVTGLFLRIDFLVASNYVLDADEGIVGLMALRHVRGESMPVFYYGQEYMGSLEPFLVSLTIDLLKVTPPVALKIVPVFFSLLFIYVLYLLGCELEGRRTGLYAALLAAIGPATLILWSSKARGGFIETVFFGALALLWTVRWLKQDPPRLTTLALIGFILGVGWWVNNQILYFMLPIGFVALSRVQSVKQFVQYLSIGLSSFLIGGLPFWLANIRSGFATFTTLGKSSGGNLVQHLTGFFSEALPILLGAERYWGGRATFEGSTLFLWILLLSMLFVVVVARAKNIRDVFWLRLSKDGAPEVLLLFLFSVMCVFCLSSFGYLSKAPRYLLPFYAGYFPLLAYALVLVRERYSKKLSAVFLLLFLTLHVLSSYSGGRALPGEPFVFRGQRVAKDHRELITWLEKHKIRTVRTNYWIGYRLAFETEERVTFHIFQEPAQVRIPEYEQAKGQENLQEVPFVLVPEQAKIVQAGLTYAGYTFEVARVSGYSVLYHIRQPQYPVRKISADEVELMASDQPELATHAFDGSLKTRWATGRPQAPGMSFHVRLTHPRKLAFLSYSLGEWPHDAPVELRVDVIDTGGKRTRVVGKKVMQALTYTFYNQPFHVALPDVEISEIVFSQNGRHPIFDWSIAEIELLY